MTASNVVVGKGEQHETHNHPQVSARLFQPGGSGLELPTIALVRGFRIITLRYIALTKWAYTPWESVLEIEVQQRIFYSK